MHSNTAGQASKNKITRIRTEDVSDEDDVVVRRHGPGASERAAARGKQPLERRRRWSSRRVHLHASPHAHAAARRTPLPPLDRGRRGAAAPFHHLHHRQPSTYVHGPSS